MDEHERRARANLRAIYEESRANLTPAKAREFLASLSDYDAMRLVREEMSRRGSPEGSRTAL